MATLHAPDGGSPLIRTDFTDDSGWRAAVAAATAPVETPYGPHAAYLVPVEEPDLAGMRPEDLAGLPRSGDLSYAFVVDAQTMVDGTFVVLSLGEENGRWFRCTATAVYSIETNLSIANMDFFEFADAAGEDGVFRGWE